MVIKLTESNIDFIEEAKELIKKYAIRDFDEDDIDFSDLSNISIYFTDDEQDNQFQVFVDLVNYEVRYYDFTLGEENARCDIDYYSSLEDMIEHFLKNLNEDDIYRNILTKFN